MEGLIMTNIVLLSTWLITNGSSVFKRCNDTNCYGWQLLESGARTNSLYKYAVHGHYTNEATSIVRVSTIGFKQGTNTITIGTNWVLLSKP